MAELRLAGADGDAREAWARQESVARENRAAAAAPDLDPTDPRWVLAVRTQSQLQGSILTPERRERVLDTARQLGVRPFEANLIIAVVQDHARRGLPLSGTAPTLAIIDRPPRSREHGYGLQFIAALALAAAGALLLAWWMGR
jgi:hypothetical protein